MVFNTYQFFVFFALFLSLYYVLNLRAQNVLLVLASYVFYGWWDWRFCGLLAVSTVVDYVCGLKIPGKHGRFWVSFSVIFQLAMLAFFKYFNFFEQSLLAAFRRLGFHADWPMLHVILPVGISFYTFQTLSYTIDLWRKKLEPERDFINFAAFVSFFPHLVAGPILRASYMLPQISNPRRVTSRDWSEGTYFILAGLVKKVAVADVISSAIQPAIDHPEQFSSWSLLLAIYLFSVRIYCDFCGYTDIARGVSLFMGFKLAENFHFPYFSRSIQEFWRRWHMSLSSWLRDYLYISMGGSRHGPWKTARNLMVTMVLGGLWHGASWSFVFWGALHGAYLVLGRLVSPWTEKSVKKLPRPLRYLSGILSALVTFHLVTFTWIFFVVTDFAVARKYVHGLFAGTHAPDHDRLRLLIYSLVVVLLIDIPEAVSGKHEYLADRPRFVRAFVYALLIGLLIVTWTSNYEPFIYFQF